MIIYLLKQTFRFFSKDADPDPDPAFTYSYSFPQNRNYTKLLPQNRNIIRFFSQNWKYIKLAALYPGPHRPNTRIKQIETTMAITRNR